MTTHVISDNPLLLIGVSEGIQSELDLQDRNKIKIHYPSSSHKEIKRNDIILICIYNKNIRMRIIKKIAARSNNIIIMVNCLFQTESCRFYPLLVSRKISLIEIYNLNFLIEKKLKMEKLKVNRNVYAIFKELYNGKAIKEIIKDRNMNNLNFSNLKNKIIKKFGIIKMNDKSIIHCMEYLVINQVLNSVVE
ncbi:TPA: hypothetical protein ACK1RR_004865 [Klebsiella michiganensis]